MTPQERKIIEQARNALQTGLVWTEYAKDVVEIDDALTAVNELLAKSDYNATSDQVLMKMPKQDPMAWLSKGGKGIWFHKPDESLDATPLYAKPQRCPNCESLERKNAELDLRLAEQDQPPFGFLTNKRQRFNFEPNATGLSNMPMTIDWKIPLYGAPQPQRKPLTDEQHEKLMRGKSTIDYGKAVEAAAHGIKE